MMHEVRLIRVMVREFGEVLIEGGGGGGGGVSGLHGRVICEGEGDEKNRSS